MFTLYLRTTPHHIAPNKMKMCTSPNKAKLTENSVVPVGRVLQQSSSPTDQLRADQKGIAQKSLKHWHNVFLFGPRNS